MKFLDAEEAENLIEKANIPGGLDRNAITVDNMLRIIPNLDNIFTAAELFLDPLYDPNAGKSWWDLHWKEAVQWNDIIANILLQL